jgi:hypothetical protein
MPLSPSTASVPQTCFADQGETWHMRTVSAAGTLDNPVLTLNIAADNSRENGTKHFSPVSGKNCSKASSPAMSLSLRIQVLP